MKKISIVLFACVVIGVAVGCGSKKIDIPLSGGQTYLIESSGKAKVFPSGSSEAAKGAQPIHRLQVKIKNENPNAKTEGCWTCTDCICNDDECTCRECTSC